VERFKQIPDRQRHRTPPARRDRSADYRRLWATRALKAAEAAAGKMAWAEVWW